jgi:predicted PhzF superfamily epimerase YddE/YHI9
MGCLARNSGAPATCFAWPRGTDGFHIRCFSPAGSIQCCGHGLLGTGYVLHNLNQETSSGHREPIRLYTDGQVEPLQVKWVAGHWWLSLPKLQSAFMAVPKWTDMAFSHKPIRAAIAGGADGYLVLEFDPEIALSTLQVDSDQICRNSARAVIATQSAALNYDFRLRYFAPQYGVDEDAVTGSAQRVLADYWSQRIGGNSFRVLQSSARGGVMLVRLHKDVVDIGGRVVLDPLSGKSR